MLRWMVVLATIGGCASPVTKAERALDRFGDGEAVAWHEARFAVESAVLDPSTKQDPEAWALRGAVYLEQLGDPSLASLGTDPVELSLGSYEAATALGADPALKDRMRREVPTLEAVVQERLSHNITVRNWHTAAQALDLAQRIHAVNLSIGTGDVEREVALRRLSCRVEAEAGDVERAADHYDALVAITQTHELPLALDVILALADRGHPDRAQGLVESVSHQLPGDLPLFEVRVGLAIDRGDLEGARATLDERRPWLSETVERSMTAAKLYSRVDGGSQARMMWSRVLEIEPDHFTAHLALGRSIARHAGALSQTWKPRFRRTPTDDEVALIRTNLDGLWSRAEGHLDRAHQLEPARDAPLAALVELYATKWAGTDPAALSGVDREAWQRDQTRRRTVEAMLGARG